MKKQFLNTFILVFLASALFSQSCLPEGIVFISQSQVDSFQINNPDCSIIEGSVTIGPENSWDEIDISNLDSLIVLTEIQGDLIVWNNDLLSDLSGLDSLEYIDGDLRIETNSSVESLVGLEQLTSVGGSLNIFGGNYITSLSGLDNLSSIGGSVQIAYGNALSDISALNSLTTMNGELKINNNVSLSTLNGLESIDPLTISSLVITSNSSLSDCAVQSLCDYLSDGTGSYSIMSNTMGCNSDNQILSACISLGVDEFSTIGIAVYPNPVNSILNIKIPANEKLNSISMYNHIGQNMLEENSGSLTIDVSGFVNGIYLIEILTDSKEILEKVIIQH